jgi:hypothetical protein
MSYRRTRLDLSESCMVREALMSIGSRTVKGIFILATIYLFSSNSLSGVAKHDRHCMQFSDSASKFSYGAQVLYMQGISVNNSYLKVSRVLHAILT